jgi:Zn-dependent peptidase ImmA (M78 family)
MLYYSNLENTVVKFLQKYHINTPDEIDLDRIAYEESIFVYYLDSPSTSRILNGMTSIVINNQNPIEQQRVEFAHELGHIFRHHGGHHATSHEMFRDLQEWQANKFAMYLLCPTFMLVEHLDKQYSPAQLARTFRVPELFMKRRLKLLEQQYYSYRLEQEMAASMDRAPKYGRDYNMIRKIGRTEYYCKDGKVVYYVQRSE